ncbi:O-antigen ligase family protein [Streptomyces buecherae]|uniref:O-antigen ligase family protein n=1 Tax=Streptomyces buecherae TaxID=2763006 RepID=UPI001E482F98|nr:O-antigen ligase family protein [Streptomyces buecherae]
MSPVLTTRHRSDRAGVVILGACAAWALLCAAGRPARPEGVLLAVLAVAAGYAGGRIVGALLPVVAPAAAAVVGLGLVLVTPHSGQAGTPGPAGLLVAYAALAVGAACCAAWASTSTPMRVGCALLALAVVVAAFGVGSVPGGLAGTAIALFSLVARRPRRLLGLVGFALCAALATGTSWATAERALPAGLSTSLQGQLTEERVHLWQDAIDITASHPVRGAGPGRFAELSPTARQTAEPASRPNSAPFQQAAEQGVPGVALLAAAFGWVLYALRCSSRTTPVVLTAGAALTALAVAAAVGNVLSFSEVTAGAGLLAGVATAHLVSEDASARRECAAHA